jgi:hypothetical protein
MGDIEKTNREKLIKIASDLEFENDFGQTPIGLGHITSNQSIIIVFSLVGLFVGTAIAGVPLAVVVLVAGLNDILSINKMGKEQESEAEAPSETTETTEASEPEAIDVDAKEVEANESSVLTQIEPAPSDPPVASPPETPNSEKPQGQSQELSLTIGSPARKILPPFDRTRIIDETKGLMIIGDMGAAKTCVAQYIANGFSGYGIIIFDPHGKTDWGNAYVISKMGAIYEQMRILLDLLENGDETPLLIICDEWLEIRGDRRNKKGGKYPGLADDFIRLFSTKPRKFNKLAAFVLHSPNVEAAGVDSFLRENYLKIYLGRIAKKEFPQIQDCAYPCVVEDEQQVHPTHGHHSEFKPKGKTPRNLEPLESVPIKIPLAYMDGSEVKVCNRGWSDGQLLLDITNIRNQLEMLFDKPEPEVEPDSSATENPEPKVEPDGSTTENPEPLNHEPEPLNQPADEGSTNLDDGSEFSSGSGKRRFTSLNLTKEQVRALVESLNDELNQTQIIERLLASQEGWFSRLEGSERAVQAVNG